MGYKFNKVIVYIVFKSIPRPYDYLNYFLLISSLKEEINKKHQLS